MRENDAKVKRLRAKLLEQGYDPAKLVPIYYENQCLGFYAMEDSPVSKIKPVLLNPELVDIDPRDKKLSKKEKQMVLEECKSNVLYYYSMVTGLPMERIAGKMIPFSYQEEFDPFTSYDRLVIPDRESVAFSMRKEMQSEKRTELKRCRIPYEITPDMIHFPKDWKPVKVPWD